MQSKEFFASGNLRGGAAAEKIEGPRLTLLDAIINKRCKVSSSQTAKGVASHQVEQKRKVLGNRADFLFLN